MEKLGIIIVWVLFSVSLLLMAALIVFLVLILTGVITLTSDGTHHMILICQRIGIGTFCNYY
jgi:hypothetical protein